MRFFGLIFGLASAGLGYGATGVLTGDAMVQAALCLCSLYELS